MKTKWNIITILARLASPNIFVYFVSHFFLFHSLARRRREKKRYNHEKLFSSLFQNVTNAVSLVAFFLQCGKQSSVVLLLCMCVYLFLFAIKCCIMIFRLLFKELNRIFLFCLDSKFSSFLFFLSTSVYLFVQSIPRCCILVRSLTRSVYCVYLFISAWSKHAFEFYLNWTARWKIGWFFFIVRYMNNSPGVTKKKNLFFFCCFKRFLKARSGKNDLFFFIFLDCSCYYYEDYFALVLYVNKFFCCCFVIVVVLRGCELARPFLHVVARRLNSSVSTRLFWTFPQTEPKSRLNHTHRMIYQKRVCMYAVHNTMRLLWWEMPLGSGRSGNRRKR